MKKKLLRLLLTMTLAASLTAGSLAMNATNAYAYSYFSGSGYSACYSSNTSECQIEFSWTISEYSKGYAVRILGENSNGKYEVIDEVAPSATSYKIKGKACLNYKSIKIQLVNDNGYVEDESEYENSMYDKNSAADNSYDKDFDDSWKDADDWDSLDDEDDGYYVDDYDNYYDDVYYYGDDAESQTNYYYYSLSDGIVGVKTPSKKQIRNMYKKLGFKDLKTVYVKAPVNKKPYKSKGKVAASTLKNGVNALNFCRYVAGIPHNVKIKKSYQNKAQASAYVNYNDSTAWISHYPNRPSGMSNKLYNLGYTGSSQSNLSAGRNTLYQSLMEGWMNDSDASNIDRLGHRRWCLNPGMKATGFGIDGNIYSMYAHDGFGNSDIHGVCWPAKNMPIEFFENDEAWSISMGEDVPVKNCKVKLTRLSDNKTWNFSSENTNKNGRYFNVENGGYGQSGCIIFRPENISYKAGDKFKVNVSGDGFSFSYTVDFFKL